MQYEERTLTRSASPTRAPGPSSSEAILPFKERMSLLDKRLSVDKLSRANRKKVEKSLLLAKWKEFLKTHIEISTIGGKSKDGKLIEYFRASMEGADDLRANSTETGDWGGRYLATSENQTKGYLTEAKTRKIVDDHGNEVEAPIPQYVMILSCYTFTDAVNAAKIPKAFTTAEALTEDDKVMLLKEVLGARLGLDFSTAPLLINALGSKGMAYVGEGGEDGDEIAMAWDFKPEGMIIKLMETHDVKATKHFETKLTKRA